MMRRTSRISGFYKKSVEERLRLVKEFASLSDEEVNAIRQATSVEILDRMIENVIGSFELPLGIATNFLINGRDYLIPMAIEEPSVVAAASNAARIARIRGGFSTTSTEAMMVGQVQVVGLSDAHAAAAKVLMGKDKILKIANEQDPVLVKLGGGARDLAVRVLSTFRGPMLVVHLLVDVRDAMGANAVNTMAEAVAPEIEKITGGRVYLRIISNLAVYRLARAVATFDLEALGGEDVAEGILDAYAFAMADPYRCATHNKGIMNGVTAVVRATGNDTRAVEAGAHAFAAVRGCMIGDHGAAGSTSAGFCGYTSLTHWERDSDGNIVGSIELPVAVGVVGGATRTHPVARAAVKILGVKTARELGEVLAAVGLAQNFAALRALAAEGIQKGHMKLHARNIAIMVGAKGNEIDLVAQEMVKSGIVRVDKAKEILERLRASGQA